MSDPPRPQLLTCVLLDSSDFAFIVGTFRVLRRRCFCSGTNDARRRSLGYVPLFCQLLPWFIVFGRGVLYPEA
ncbi:hypothetical protein K474DRAFT_1661425 [Panus rudis PR-1116 ss-1]|nr:hypothetical protein K474DRAFT_1661425 [Panus rudis PR-1116 ss-1]